MNDLLALVPTMLLLARRAGWLPLTLALGVAVLGGALTAGFVALIGVFKSAGPIVGFLVALVGALSLGGFRTVACAAYVIALDKRPTAREVLELGTARLVVASAILLNAVGSVFWTGAGTDLMIMPFVTSGVPAGISLLGVPLLVAGFYIQGRHIALSTVLLLVEGRREGGAHRDRISDIVKGRRLVVIVAGAIPFVLLMATAGGVFSRDLGIQIVPGVLSRSLQVAAVVASIPLGLLLDALAGTALYGVLTDRCKDAPS